MAKATEGTPQNPQVQGEGDEGTTKPEYLVEKFSSVEDQAKAYRDLEKKYHEDLASVKSEISALKRGVPVEDTRAYTPQPDDDNAELVEFYKSPSAYRRRVIEEAKLELRQEESVKEGIRQVLSRFFSQNTDLVGHEKLLEGYVREENPRLDPHDRLERAAKKTREYIASLRKAPEPRPSPEDFVDEPSGVQPRVRSQSPKMTEDDLRADFFKSAAARKLPPKALPQGE